MLNASQSFMDFIDLFSFLQMTYRQNQDQAIGFILRCQVTLDFFAYQEKIFKT